MNDEVTLGLRIASGDPGDPVSTNQSFSEFFTRKPIAIDQIFLTYTPRVVPWLTLGGGKFGYPVSRTQLTWDDDLNWEGTYQQIAPRPAAPVSFKIVAIQSPVNEVGAGDDAFMLGEYVQVGFKRGRHTFQVSAADYTFLRVDQVAVGFDTKVLRTQNTNVVSKSPAGAVTGFVSEFNLVDIIAQATFATTKAEYPIRLLAEWVVNTGAVNGQDTGVWLVAGYGRAVTLKTLALTYTFARIEQDAVLSTFNFSDMPGSSVSMHMIGLSSMLLARLNLDLTGIFTKRLVVPSGASDALLTRLQLDARVTF